MSERRSKTSSRVYFTRNAELSHLEGWCVCVYVCSLFTPFYVSAPKRGEVLGGSGGGTIKGWSCDWLRRGRRPGEPRLSQPTPDSAGALRHPSPSRTPRSASWVRHLRRGAQGARKMSPHISLLHREVGRRSREEPPNMLHLNVVGDLLRAVDSRRRDVLFSVRAG